MATWTPELTPTPRHALLETIEPRTRTILAAMGISLAFVFLTRWPIARSGPIDPDEFGFLDQVAVYWFPMHHTLFQTLGRVFGALFGDNYRGFILVDILSSALALVTTWWWLRALVRPGIAVCATLMLGVGPIFWGYGAMAGNYTAIVLVGSFLLGVAIRGHSCPRAWHAYASAAMLAAGTGYRPDIGTFWLPVLCVILWQHRWKHAILAGIAFTVLNLAWYSAMLHDVGGWTRYQAATAAFGREAGLRNSLWHLGFVDGPLRYSLKLGMALIWTLGPALLFVPRGALRLRDSAPERFLSYLLVLSALPALTFHLLIHFGVPGYCFHYLPGLIALVALGIGRIPSEMEVSTWTRIRPSWTDGERAIPRLLGISVIMAAAFWFYPTNYATPGWRGDLDLAFCRFTRAGLEMPIPRVPTVWRTANSRDLAGRLARDQDAATSRE